ncbi:MAG: phosphoribosylamine--glycine ligase [Endomicrobiales bacterium]
MNILVIGSGAREHALVWKIRQSPKAEKIFCAPGNAGISRDAECLPLKADDFAGLEKLAREKNIGLTVVGPEVPLAAGIVDYFRERGLEIFGPDKSAARLEASKVFAKDFMKRCGIPTAAYHAFTDAPRALEFLGSDKSGKPLVVKADGLAAGKGVLICATGGEAEAAVRQIMEDRAFGAAGKEIVIEEFLAGEETSVQVFLDGKHYLLMAAAQDHKRVFDDDRGPNTGGMGAYAPAPLFDAALREKVEKKIMAPLLEGFGREKITYRGVLYLGLMVSHGEPYVLEFNCRFGDPETQVVLPLLKTDLVEIMQKINRDALDKIEIEWYNKAAVCVVLASGGYPGDYGKGEAIKGLDEAGRMKDAIIFHAGTAFDAAGAPVTAGGRVLGVTGVGPSLPEAISTAYKAAGTINFAGMHYRKDIGKRALSRL